MKLCTSLAVSSVLLLVVWCSAASTSSSRGGLGGTSRPALVAGSGRSITPLLNEEGNEIGTISTLCISAGVGSTNLFSTKLAAETGTVGFNLGCHWNVTTAAGAAMLNECSNPCCKVDVFPPKVYDCRCCNALEASAPPTSCVSTGCGNTVTEGGECTSMCVNNPVPSAEAFASGGGCPAVMCTSYLNPPKISECKCVGTTRS